jgi:hypothetical protein
MCEMVQEQEEGQQHQHKNKNLLKEEQWKDDWSVYITKLQLPVIDLLFKYAYMESCRI